MLSFKLRWSNPWDTAVSKFLILVCMCLCTLVPSRNETQNNMDLKFGTHTPLDHIL